jgi:hypothetical protein
MSAPILEHPRSRAELLRNARRAARVVRGRTAFVRDDRLLRVGLPLGVAAAALGYAGRRRAGASPAAATGAAAAAFAGTMALTAAVALAEWGLDMRRS